MSELAIQPRRWLRFEFEGMTPAAALLFYVAAPLLVGLLLGWNRMLVGSHVSRGSSTLFWTGLVALVWVAAIVGTRLVAALTRRWSLPLWLTAAAGALIGILLFYWPIARYRHFGLGMLPEEFMQHAPPLPWLTLDYLPNLLSNTLPGILYWVVVVSVFDKWTRLHRTEHRGVDPGASMPSATERTAVVPVAAVPGSAGAMVEAALRARLPPHLDAEIIALKAEDHYLRVYTAKGDTLIHYRFRDALHDLREMDGLQVHRSYWVRRAAIKERYTKAHSQFLRVGEDLSIPISRSFQRQLEASHPGLAQGTALTRRPVRGVAATRSPSVPEERARSNG